MQQLLACSEDIFLPLLYHNVSIFHFLSFSADDIHILVARKGRFFRMCRLFAPRSIGRRDIYHGDRKKEGKKTGREMDGSYRISRSQLLPHRKKHCETVLRITKRREIYFPNNGRAFICGGWWWPATAAATTAGGRPRNRGKKCAKMIETRDVVVDERRKAKKKKKTRRL